jgi:predicted negative regulator of RcsB-dependent stress response
VSDSGNKDSRATARSPALGERSAGAASKKKGVGDGENRDRNRRVRDEALAKRGGQRDKSRAMVARGLDTSEMVDDALARSTHAVVQWTKNHFNAIQWVFVVGVALGIGWQIYSWRKSRSNEKVSDLLFEAVRAEQAKVADKQPEGEPTADEQTGLADDRRVFSSEEARLTTAVDQYRETLKSPFGKDAVTLASVGLAGALHDQGKYPEALKLYSEVKESELARSDADLRARAVEGVGLCYEGMGDTEKALKAFRELENTDIAEYTPLGQYHQARLLFSKGDKSGAKELLKKAAEKLKNLRIASQPIAYLEEVVHDLLVVIDPNAAATTPSSATEEQLRRLQDELANLNKAGEKSSEQLKKLLEKIGVSAEDLKKAGGPAQPAPKPNAPP